VPQTRLILIELNELCPHLLDDFMSRGMLPNFKRFHDSSTVYVTDAAEQPPNLEPWIQWPSVHSGMSFEEHQIFHLGDGRKLKRKLVGELLSDAGLRVGVFESMNTNYSKLNGYVVPDPWDKAGAAYPDWLSPFYETVSGQVQESSRESAFTLKDMMKFGTFLAGNGLTLKTASAVASELMDEKRDPGVKWRRASLLDQMQYDVFRSLNKKFDVQFATFFSNSTAHYQHYFWRNMEPDKLQVRPAEGDHKSLDDAIAFGYRQMDDLIGKFMADYPDALLVFCTALSQQPWTDTTKVTYRPKDFTAFLKFAGIDTAGVELKPVMAEQFHAEFPDEPAARKAADLLGKLTVDGEPMMLVDRQGNDVFTGCKIIDPHASEKTIVGAPGGPAAFSDVLYMIHSMRSGRHHPDGALWIRGGDHRRVAEKVPLTAIAPTVLAHFDVAQPAYMRSTPLSA
jgi:hypothetical protein